MDKSFFLDRMRHILLTDTLTEDHEISPVTWDSLEFLETIDLIDQAGKTVAIADIQKCRSVGDLMQLAGAR